MEITRGLRHSKVAIIQYFRDKSAEYEIVASRECGTDHKEKCKKMNTSLSHCRNEFITSVRQVAIEENWTKEELLESILMITYCNYVVMLETRNSIWAYEYMTFSRRIGELWEPFCKLVFEYPINNLELIIPPSFVEIKAKMERNVTQKIDGLNISVEDKRELLASYDAVWEMVTSGEIQMNLDLHFKIGENKYVVDFKSGFGSNEKGNTNRLLLVAKIYHGLNDNYIPMIFVRSAENNHYFNTLRNSGIWRAYSGNATYDEIHRYSGYNIKHWIDNNIDWENDLSAGFVQHLRDNDLLQYLTW